MSSDIEIDPVTFYYLNMNLGCKSFGISRQKCRVY